MDCDIIDNTACGKTFQYCRTHKTEPHDCPQNIVLESPPPFPKDPMEKYNLGQKLRCLVGLVGANFTPGQIYTIYSVNRQKLLVQMMDESGNYPFVKLEELQQFFDINVSYTCSHSNYSVTNGSSGTVLLRQCLSCGVIF